MTAVLDTLTLKKLSAGLSMTALALVVSSQAMAEVNRLFAFKGVADF